MRVDYIIIYRICWKAYILKRLFKYVTSKYLQEWKDQLS